MHSFRFKEWLQFLRSSNVPKFPRDMMQYRIKVQDTAEYLWWLTRCYERMDCYVAVYSDPQILSGEVDTIFLDIDAENIQEAQGKLNQLRKVLDDMNLVYRVYFSGAKGFHVYIDFEPVKLRYPGFAIKKFVTTRLPHVMDFTGVGDVRRLARVPYTINQKTGVMSFRVNPELLPTHLSDVPPELPYGYNDTIGGELLDLDALLAESEEPIDMAEEGKIPEWEGPAPPCIVDIITRLKETGELSHQERLHLAAFVIQAGYDVNVVMGLLARYAKDFSMAATQYQLSKLLEARFSCYTCSNAQLLGFCPLGKDAKECLFYPSINSFLRRCRQ
jgi:hypothetical protein